MNKREIAIMVFSAALAACATWRWSGSPPPVGRGPNAPLRGVAEEESRHAAPPVDVSSEDAAAVRVSTVPSSPRAVVPLAPEERVKNALFYSDLGPDAIDVSAYPAQQRFNYAIYARTCSSCHTLARSINAPVVGRGWWEFYMLGMRMRSRNAGRPLSSDAIKTILDFLEYDSRARKVEKARDFDTLTEELKRRFDALVAERMKALQKQRTRALPSPER